jgi:hypothetical protein
VFGGLSRLLAFALVAGVLLVVPPAAMACSGGVSAVNVYKECVPSGGGGNAAGSKTGTHKTGGSTTPTAAVVHIPAKTVKKLKKAGKDEKSISALVKSYGAVRLLQSHSSHPTATPTAIGSAFDLGSGPTVLLIVLVGTAVLLLGGSGMRVRRNRQRP